MGDWLGHGRLRSGFERWLVRHAIVPTLVLLGSSRLGLVIEALVPGKAVALLLVEQGLDLGRWSDLLTPTAPALVRPIPWRLAVLERLLARSAQLEILDGEAGSRLDHDALLQPLLDFFEIDVVWPG